MNLEQCYAALGGDFADVLGRLRAESLVRRFLLKFLDDPNYQMLRTALESGDGTTAFRAAHTLKGVCQNLSFTALYTSSARLCEALRDGNISPDAPELLSAVERDYDRTASAIRSFQAENP